MKIGQKAILRILPTDPKTGKSLGAFTIYNDTIKSQRKALKKLREAFE